MSPSKKDRKRAAVHGYQLFCNENGDRFCDDQPDLQEMLYLGTIQEEKDRNNIVPKKLEDLHVHIYYSSSEDTESELDADQIEYDPEDYEHHPYMIFIMGENPIGIVELHLGSQRTEKAILYVRSKLVSVVGVWMNEAEADEMLRKESDVVYYRLLPGKRRLH